MTMHAAEALGRDRTQDVEQDTVSRSRVEWAPVPKVNLLPPEILEARRFVGVQRVLGGGVLGTVVLCGAAVLWAQAGVAGAQGRLEETQAVTRTLQAEQARYADVPRVLAQVESARTVREQALGQDVAWYRFLNDLARSTPVDVSLESVAVTMSSAAGGAAAVTGGDPLSAAGLGAVSFSGTATRFPAVATWLESIAAVHGLDSSSLQTAGRDGDAAGGSVAWSSSVQVTTDALTHRYDRKGS